MIGAVSYISVVSFPRLYAGHSDPSSYTFYHWSLVDEFVYFSHELVTVPPCCWVDAAHRHGVAIYGEGTLTATVCNVTDHCSRLFVIMTQV